MRLHVTRERRVVDEALATDVTRQQAAAAVLCMTQLVVGELLLGVEALVAQVTAAATYTHRATKHSLLSRGPAVCICDTVAKAQNT